MPATTEQFYVSPGKLTRQSIVTFVEIHCAHCVAYHCLKLVQLLAALQQLVSQALVQVSVANHSLTQNHLFKLGQEGSIHRLFGDDNGAGLKP